MGYRNLDSFYTTSKMAALKLGFPSKKEFNKKFEDTLSALGFEDSHMAWYRSYGNKHPVMYIFSGDNVIGKLGRLFELVNENCPAHEEMEISDILVSIIPDEKYRTVSSRYENVVTKSFDPETDPRSEGVRWIIANCFHHMI